MVKEVKHNEVEVGHKECENGQQKQELSSTKMGGDEHCTSLQDKKKKGKYSYIHKNIMLEFINTVQVYKIKSKKVNAAIHMKY